LSFGFTKCIGIELLKDLYELSKSLLDKPREDLLCKDINFILGDILEYQYDYENTSLLFANCKTFDKSLMNSIAAKLKQMPKDVIFITTTQTINDYDEDWEIIDRIKRLMSWGSATIYIHKKIK
jgi:hypothetical protein